MNQLSKLLSWALAMILVLCSGLNAKQTGLGRGGQIRGGFIHVDRGSTEAWDTLPEMARRGMNAVFLAPENVTPQERQEIFDRWQRKTESLGLQLFPVVLLYGRGEYEHWPLKRRWFVGADGQEYRHTPCPNDADFWQRKMTNTFVQIARWAKDKPNVPGIMFDAEMYGADTSAFKGACFCPSCRREIAAELGIDAKNMDLDDKRMLARYEEVSTKLAQRSLVQTRLQVQAIYPDCLLGGLVLDRWGGDGTTPFYKAIALAWGTKEHPLLILSEATYGTGYHAAHASPGKPLVRPTGSYVKGRPSTFGLGDHPGYIEGWQKRWKNWGAHVDFLGGMLVERFPHENYAENLYHMAKNTRGYWVYHMRLFGGEGSLPGEGSEAYWEAIDLANEELDKLLASGGSYISPLKVRPFTLPAPAINLGRWRREDLPVLGRAAGRPAFWFRSHEIMFYIPAKAGDEVKLTVMADSAHPTKVKTDALAIVLVDPDGKVIKRDKMTAEDLLAGTKQPGGTYIGERQVRFRATQAGAYGLYLKCIRYSYTISESSHAWLTSLRHPGGIHSTRFDRPREFYLQTARGARQAQWSLSAAPTNKAIVVRVFDEDGRQLAQEELVGSVALKRRGSATITVPLRRAEPQILRVVFETPEKARDVNIYPRKGLELWIGPSADAPFPRD